MHAHINDIRRNQELKRAAEFPDYWKNKGETEEKLQNLGYFAVALTIEFAVSIFLLVQLISLEDIAPIVTESTAYTLVKMISILEIIQAGSVPLIYLNACTKGDSEKNAIIGEFKGIFVPITRGLGPIASFVSFACLIRMKIDFGKNYGDEFPDEDDALILDVFLALFCFFVDTLIAYAIFVGLPCVIPETADQVAVVV